MCPLRSPRYLRSHLPVVALLHTVGNHGVVAWEAREGWSSMNDSGVI